MKLKKHHFYAGMLLFLLLVNGLVGFSQGLEQKTDGYYKDGVLFDGVWKDFHPNGNVASERTFIRGQENGISVYFDTTGVVLEQRAWSNGKNTAPGSPTTAAASKPVRPIITTTSNTESGLSGTTKACYATR